MFNIKDSLKIKYVINLLGCLLIAGLIALTGCWNMGFGSYEQRTDQVKQIAADNYGNVYVVGQFRDTVDFDPGPDEFSLTAAG